MYNDEDGTQSVCTIYSHDVQIQWKQGGIMLMSELNTMAVDRPTIPPAIKPPFKQYRSVGISPIK